MPRDPGKSLLAGLVMAGGKSRRMGTDKASLGNEDGTTFLELACGKIAALTSRWHVSCARGEWRNPWPCLEDPVRDFGPVAGLYQGLEDARTHDYGHLLVLACDMPCMDTGILLDLLDAHLASSPAPLLTVYQNSQTGQLEMLAGIYNVESLPWFRLALKLGQRKLKAVLPAKYQQIIPYGQQMAKYFFNCNTNEDMSLYQSRRSCAPLP